MIKLLNLIAASIFSTLLLFPSTTKAEDYPLIGISYPPLPEGVNDRGGWLIDESYSVNQVSIQGQKLLLLDRLTGRDSQGRASFQVIDVLKLPLMYKTEEITGGSSCSVNSQEDPSIVVIAKSSNTEFFNKARKAWRVKDGKFNEISVQGLQFQCENFNYGL